MPCLMKVSTQIQHLVRGHRAKVQNSTPCGKKAVESFHKIQDFNIIPLKEYRKPIEEIKSRIRSIKGQIAALGEINVGAIQEYQRV